MDRLKVRVGDKFKWKPFCEHNPFLYFEVMHIGHDPITLKQLVIAKNSPTNLYYSFTEKMVFSGCFEKYEEESSAEEHIKMCINNGVCIICGEETNAYPFQMTHCRACANKDMDKKAKNIVKEKMNIKDAIIALYKGKKVRSLIDTEDGTPCGYEYVLRDGKIKYLYEYRDKMMLLGICEKELHGEWEIIEDD